MTTIYPDEKGHLYTQDGLSTVDQIMGIRDKQILFQLNDLYHIDTRVDWRGLDTLILPRIATLLQRFNRRRSSREQKSRCAFVLCGDFLAPSELSRRCDHGRQMIEVLNAIGITHAAFGNHEFDRFRPGISDTDLQEAICSRIEQSNFPWILSNATFNKDVFYKSGKIVKEAWLQAREMKLRLIGLLTNKSDYPPFVDVLDPLKEVSSLTSSPPGPAFTVALTHLDLSEDHDIAPYCCVVLGGHDHDEYEPFVVQRSNDSASEEGLGYPRGTKGIGIKALSNARSLAITWVVLLERARFDGMRNLKGSSFSLDDSVEIDQLAFQKARDEIIGERVLYDLGEALFDDDFVDKDPRLTTVLALLESSPPGHNSIIVNDWRPRWDSIPLYISISIDTAAKEFQDIPPDQEVQALIEKIIAQHKGSKIFSCPTDLGLADQQIRSQSTNFGNFVADCIRVAAGTDVQCAFINSGSFRLGRDLVKEEEVTDLIMGDIFYFDNRVTVCQLTGADLAELLRRSQALRGSGDFLQISGTSVRDGTPEPSLETSRLYTIAATDYVATICKHYRDFFAKKNLKYLNDTVKTIVSSKLTSEISEASFPSEMRWHFENN